MTYPFKVPTNRDEATAQWAARDIIALLCKPGYMSPDTWRPVTMCAVIMGESAGWPCIISKPLWRPGLVYHMSVDVGLFQFNSRDHVDNDTMPGIGLMRTSLGTLLDPHQAMARAWITLNHKKPNGWTYNMNWWMAYTSGAYRVHVTAATRAMREYRITMGLGPGAFG